MKKTILGHKYMYNTGPAKWWQGHTVIYPNGKTTFATLKECQEFLRNEPYAYEHPTPRRREAIEHTRRKLGL